MRQECFKRFFIRSLLTRRRRNGPASERIKPPRPDVVRIRFRGIGFLQRLRLVEVAVRHVHEPRSPLIFVASVNAPESLRYIAGIKPDQRILPHLSAVNSLHPDLVDVALTALFFLVRGALSKSASRNECEKQQ